MSTDILEGPDGQPVVTVYAGPDLGQSDRRFVQITDPGGDYLQMPIAIAQKISAAILAHIALRPLR
jgi:hypothetical protein